MFKNRSLQVSVVKTQPTNNTPEEVVVNPYLDPEKMNIIAQDLIKNTAITIGAAVGGYKVLTTICEIAKIAAKAKL
jgi:hypothetical protein